MIGKTAKQLLSHGSFETYIRSIVEEKIDLVEVFEKAIIENYYGSVKEALLEQGEDLEDWSPEYDTWSEFMTYENETIISEITSVIIYESNFDGYIISNHYDMLYNTIYSILGEYLSTSNFI
jgi:hypothetical protein